MMNTVDDFTDPFRSPPARAPAPRHGMTRSQSEWAFQRFLEEISVSAGTSISSSSATDNAIGRSTSQLLPEPSVSKQEEAAASDIADVVEIPKPQIDRRVAENRSRVPLSDAQIDPIHYQAILKRKLHRACAAVALRVATVKPEDSSASSCNQNQLSLVGSQTQGPVVTQNSPGVSSVSTAPSLGTQNKPDSQARQATSGSSRADSDDKDLDGDTETTKNADPADVKRARRMLSNRESARRSRRRKQEQMNELDTQVGQLQAEHSTLLKRLSDMNQKYDMATVDYRILKADIETLRTKVKMAEETVKRVTGMNSLLLARPNSIPFNSTPKDSSQPNSNHTLKPENPDITGMIPNQRLGNNIANNTVVPLNMSPVFPTSCNAYGNSPHWNQAAGINKRQE